MKYSIHGPFKIIRVKKTGLIDRDKAAKKSFWNMVGKEVSSSCGCYLFAIQAAKGIKPWYIGLAAKQSFEKECFTPQKINIYNEVLASGSGTPLLFLVAKRTNKGKIVKPSKNGHKKDIIFLETMLIATAREKNRKLKNKMKTKYLRKMIVPGLINTPRGKQSNPESEFKKAIK